MLIKGTKAHRRKVSSAWLIVYTTHLIRAGLDLQDHVPILSVLGLPLDMVRARVKFWSGTDGTKSFTRQYLSVPNQLFWYASFFYPSRTKNFLQCKWALTRHRLIQRTPYLVRYIYAFENFNDLLYEVGTSSRAPASGSVYFWPYLACSQV